MAKKKPKTVSADVALFAAAMYKVLDRDAWGDIDPYLFRSIGENYAADDDEEKGIAEAIEAGLKAIEERKV